MVLMAQSLDEKEVIKKRKVNGVWIRERREEMEDVVELDDIKKKKKRKTKVKEDD